MVEQDITTLGILAGALAGSLFIGAFAGFRFADRRLKKQYAEVRQEVARLRAIAEDKLATEEPDLDAMLRNLNDAVQDTFKAASALENHEAVVARQHEGGKEVIASSRFIIRMIDDLGGEPLEPAPEKLKATPAIKLTADQMVDKRPTRRIR